jgi:hypothetical protein
MVARTQVPPQTVASQLLMGSGHMCASARAAGQAAGLPHRPAVFHGSGPHGKTADGGAGPWCATVVPCLLISVSREDNRAHLAVAAPHKDAHARPAWHTCIQSGRRGHAARRAGRAGAEAWEDEKGKRVLPASARRRPGKEKRSRGTLQVGGQPSERRGDNWAGGCRGAKAARTV